MADRLRVLLVEDNPGDERLLREHLGALERISVDLHSVAELEHAIIKLDEEAFDVVLADLGLPDSQGLNTVSSLLANAGETPVVVLTGADDHELAERAIQAGAQDYLPKHALTPELLLRTITHAIERQHTREIIRESEQRFRAIFEASPLAIAIVRANEKGFIAANRAFGDLLGYDIDEILSLSIADVTHPDDLAEDERGIRAILDGSQETFTREKRLIQKDGSVIWVGAAGTVLRDAAGVPEQFLLVQQNITAEKEATLALEAERQRLRSVMETMPAFLYLQAADRTIPFANSRFRKYFGDPEGRMCHQIFRGSDAPCEPCGTLAVLETRVETVREWTDAQDRVFEIRERPFTGAGGEDLVLVIGTEITDLIQATHAMWESERRFRELAEMLPEVVFECDLEGKLTFANQVAFDRFGYSQAEFDVGLHVVDMLATEDRGRARANVARLLRGSEEHGSQYSAIRSDGSTFPAIIHSSVILQNEKPRGLRGILVDITEHVEAQRAILESESRHRLLFESAPVGIGYHSVDGETLAINDTAVSRLRGKREDYLGKHISDYSRDPDEVKRRFALAMESQEGYSFEDRVERSGADYWYQRSYTPMRDASGDVVGVQVISTDITAVKEAQEAVRASEARHRLLFESAPVGIGYFTTEGDIIALNRIAARRLGGEPDEYVGVNVASYTKDPSEALRRFSEAAGSNEIATYEDMVESPEGIRHVLRSYNSLRDSNDAVVGIQVISSEITEQKNAQLRFHLAATTASDLIYEWDVSSGNLHWFGDIDAALGYGHDTIPHTVEGWRQLVHPDDLEQINRSRESHLTSPSAIHQEYRVKTASGKWRDWEDRASPVLDNKGAPVRWIGVCVDITDRKNAEAALRTADDIVRSSPVGMFIYHYEDPGRLILVDANPEAEKLAEFQLSEWRGRELNDVWPEARTAGLTDACLAAFTSNITYSADELAYKDRNMSGHFRVRAFRIPGDRLVVSFEDISELREAEQALRQSEIQYRSLFENAALGIYQTTPDGRILAANPALIKLLGYSSFEELATRNLEEEGYEPETPRSEFKQRLERKGSFIGRESSWKRKDGTALHVRENARIVRDDDGKVLYYEGTLEDVTERKQSEAAVRASERRYRSIVELSPVGIVTVDLSGRISSCNQSFLSMTGYSGEELVGKHFTKLPPARARDLPKYIRAFRSIVVGKTPDPFEASWTTKSGEIRFGEIHVTIMTSDEEAWSVQVIVQDITDRKRSEGQLRDSLATQRSILQASPIGIGLIRHSKFQWISDRISEITGYPSEELIGQTPEVLSISEGEYQRVQGLMAPGLEQTGTGQAETRWRMKNGMEIDVLLHYSNLSTEEPSQGGIFTVLDITERKRIERSLELTQFSMDSTDVIILWVLPSGEIVFTNDAACRMLGYPRDELLGQYVWDTTFEYPQGRRQELWDELKTVGVESSETRLMRKDGTEFSVELTAQYLEFRGTEYEFVIAVDITERKAAEAALQQSEENYRTIFDSASDAIMLHDSETGRLLDVNQKAAEMYGYPLDEFVELQVDEFSSGIAPYTQDGAITRLHAAARGEAQVFEWHCKKKSGELFWVEVSLRQVTLLGESVVLAVVRDISERKELEATLRQGQKLEAIGTLASGVAHEINNPLMGMINYAELISSRVGDESLKEFAEGIKEEGDRVAKIVRNLLSFSRQDQEQQSLARMRDIVDASLSLIGSLLRKDFVQLDVDIPKELPAVRCRSQQIQQVLINLITNARDSLNAKFPETDSNKRVRISSRLVRDKDKEWIRTTIEDFGIGIPDDIADRIFDPFFTTKTRDEGTGLGLSISYGIVRDHGGRLLVELEPGQFTRFHVDLPMPEESG